MQHLAELLKQAIAEGVLNESDLYLQEQSVIAKLLSSHLRAKWQEFRNLKQIFRSTTPKPDGVWRQIPAKKRYIDPYVLNQGRVSEICPNFLQELNAFKNASQSDWLSAK